MSKNSIAITDDRHVYRLDGVGPRMLGHIACVAIERTPNAAEARAWWRQLAAEGPLGTFDYDNERTGAESALSEVPETVLAIGGDVEELAEALLTD